jgi:hypothetical protein
MQYLLETIKRPKLQILGIEQEKGFKKGIQNTFNKTIAENFLNLKEEMVIHVWRHLGLKTDMTRKEPISALLQ